MSLIAVRNGLVATIQNYGKWAASEISACDFGIMNSSASCVVLQPGADSIVTPLTFSAPSRNYDVEWHIAGVVFVKDTGDPTSFLAAMWTACDDILNSIQGDDSLNGSCLEAHVSTIGRPSWDSFISDGNIDWAFVTFTVSAHEFPV